MPLLTPDELKDLEALAESYRQKLVELQQFHIQAMQNMAADAEQERDLMLSLYIALHKLLSGNLAVLEQLIRKVKTHDPD